MLDFQDEVVRFKLKGKEYEIEKPNNGQISEYTKSFNEAKTNEEKETCLKNWLEKLGLKKETYNLLNSNQTEQLLKSLHGSEKN